MKHWSESAPRASTLSIIGPSNGVDNLSLLGPEGALACIAGIPDLSVVPDLPYSISIHDIGLGGVMASPAFRRRQEDLVEWRQS